MDQHFANYEKILYVSVITDHIKHHIDRHNQTTISHLMAPFKVSIKVVSHFICIEYLNSVCINFIHNITTATEPMTQILSFEKYYDSITANAQLLLNRQKSGSGVECNITNI